VPVSVVAADVRYGRPNNGMNITAKIAALAAVKYLFFWIKGITILNKDAKYERLTFFNGS
jgi:hypothetical protein